MITCKRKKTIQAGSQWPLTSQGHRWLCWDAPCCRRGCTKPSLLLCHCLGGNLWLRHSVPSTRVQCDLAGCLPYEQCSNNSGKQQNKVSCFCFTKEFITLAGIYESPASYFSLCRRSLPREEQEQIIRAALAVLEGLLMQEHGALQANCLPPLCA